MLRIFNRYFIYRLTARAAETGRLTIDGPTDALIGSWGDDFRAMELGRAETGSGGGVGTPFGFGIIIGRGDGCARSTEGFLSCITVWLNSSLCF